jgi:hypothetical protein
MTNKNESAFPIQSVYIEDQDTNSRGMTLRDYFAAKAMQGMIGGKWPTTYGERLHISEFAYDMADAMMKAREA